MPARSLDVSVRGAQALRREAARYRTEARRLPRDLRRAAERALDVIPPLVRAEVPRVVPARYGRILGPALRFSKTVRLVRAGGVGMTVSAQGRREQRDVRAINAGRLRHPVYGNRQVWVAQRVPRGLVDTPFRKAEPVIVDRLAKVRDDLHDRLARG